MSLVKSMGKLTATFAPPVTTGRDGIGGRVLAWGAQSEPFDVWIQPASSSTIIAFGQRRMVVSHRIFLDKKPPAGTGWQMVAADGRKFEIRRVEDQAGVGQVWAIYAEEVQVGGE